MATPESVHLRDTRANQPAAAVGNAGVIFCVTDEGDILERSNGTTWESYSPPSVDESNVNITGGSITGITDLAIADGGTGASTATAAFDNLAPTTTAGDLIYNNGTDNVRLGIGTAGQVLTVNAGATAPEWAASAGGGGALDDLTDVDAPAPSDGDVLTFDSGSGDWIAAAPTGGGGSAGQHMIWVPAGAITPSVTGGCQSLTTIASASNQPDIQTLNFDATTQEYAQFSVGMPESWNEGTITFAPVWSHPATTTNFGVVFDLQAVAVSNDDAIATAFGTAQTSTDTGGTTDDLYIGPTSSAITVAGTPAAGDQVFFRLSRVTGNGSDTMAVDARLHGIRLYITTDASTD